MLHIQQYTLISYEAKITSEYVKMGNTYFLPKICNRAQIRNIRKNLKVKWRIDLSCRQMAVMLKDKNLTIPFYLTVRF